MSEGNVINQYWSPRNRNAKFVFLFFGFFSLVSLQAWLFLASEPAYLAATYIALLSIIACRHSNNNQILLFCLFVSVTGFEIVITEVFHLDYYFVLKESQLPKVIFIQSIVLYPLLALRPLPKISDFPIIFFRRYMYYLLWVVTFALVLFGFGGKFALGGSYEAYRENLASGSGLIEYLIIVFVILVSFRRDRFQNLLLFVLVFLYVIKCLVLGFRIQAVMGALLIVYVFLSKTGAKGILILAVVGGILGLVAGVLKHSFEFNAAMLVMNAGYIQTPHNGALVSSTVIVSDSSRSLVQSLSTIFAWIFPRSAILDTVPWAYPMSYIQREVGTPGGSLFGVYGYAVGGWLGVVVVSSVIFMISSGLRFYSSKSELKLFGFYAALTFFVFMPRWTLYDFGSYGIRSSITFIVLNLILFIVVRSRKIRISNNGGAV